MPKTLIVTPTYNEKENLPRFIEAVRKAAMTYGKYSGYGLADKVVFSFNTKDYKLP